MTTDFATLSLICWVVVQLTDGLSISDILEKSTKTRPRNGENGPLKVHVGFYLESIGNFRSNEMAFDVDLYVYMSWKDSRLAHNRSTHVLINDLNIRNQMWLPDLYFANARQATFQDVTVPNFNMFVSNDGTVAYSCRATCSISCSLQLVNYPMDKQWCYIRVLSYGHVAHEVDVHWFSSNAMRYNPEIGLPEFRITNVSEGYCNGTYRYALTEHSYSIGNFSCLMGNIFLSRSIGYNLVQSYIPTGLIVMISWVSFWIDRRAVPARVTLSFTTLVSLTTLGNGLRFGLPQVSYAKAIDLWYGACMFFVFCALLEFALINSYMRKSEKYDHLSKTMANSPRYNKLVKNAATFSPALNGNRICGGRKRASTDKGTDLSLFSKSNGPVMFGAGENHKSPQRAPVLNGYARNGRISMLSSVCEETPLTEDLNGAYILSKLTETITGQVKTNGEMQESASSAVSMYDNVTPVRKLPPMRAIDDDDFLPADLTDSEDDDLQIKAAIALNGGAKKWSRSGDSNSLNMTKFYTTMSIEASRYALKIDKWCRYLFPGTFILFNFLYWWYYLVYEDRPMESDPNYHNSAT